MELNYQNNAEKLLSPYVFDIDYGTTNDDLTCTKCKKLLSDAYQTFCGCQYCRACIVDYLSEGERYCCGGKEGCNDEPLVIDGNVLKNAMLNRKISKVKVICPNKLCRHSAELVQMEDHMRVCTKKSIECPYLPLGCDTEEITKDTILIHLDNETLPHTQLLIDLIQHLRNDVGALKDKLEILSLTNKTEIAELRTVIERIKEECAEKERTEGDTRTKIDQLVTTIKGIDIITNTIGVTTITVDRFEDRMAANEYFNTPYFYSHLNGYKLRLRIYPLFCGTYLSVHIYISKGEYDDILVWPCKYIFEVALINQSTGGVHLSETFSYDTTDKCKHCFDKPIADYIKHWYHKESTIINKDNSAIGNTNYKCVADLRSVVGLIVDDSVQIQCTVRPPIID